MASAERLSSADLSKKTTAELQELLERQQKLLANRKFIASLPDKGEKIIVLKKTLEDLLHKRRNLKSVTDLLSNLRISPKALSLKIVEDNEANDVKENEPTVWETLASNGLPRKITNYEIKSSHTKSSDPDSQQMVTTEYLAECKTTETSDNTRVFYNHLAKAVDSLKETDEKKQLKLYKTLRSSEIPKQPSSQETKSKRFLIEENSAVRYPTGPHKETKLLTMEESLGLQKQSMEQLQQLQVRQAAEQLAGRAGIKIGNYVPDPVTTFAYREQSPETESNSESDIEELD